MQERGLAWEQLWQCLVLGHRSSLSALHSYGVCLHV